MENERQLYQIFKGRISKKIGNKLSVVRRKERVKRESKTLVFFWRTFRIFTEMKESARRTGKRQYILLSNNIEFE